MNDHMPVTEPVAIASAKPDTSTYASRTVIIVRHAARQDKCDPNWVWSTPTPYDSPLSSEGFRDAEQIAREVAAAVPERSPGSSTVVLSSPFLRCTQTALPIAVALLTKLKLVTVFGEWMTPDYFEETGAPPSDGLTSVVSSSLAWILNERREYVNHADFSSDPHQLGESGLYGEEFDEMHDRACQGLSKALLEYRDAVVVIVTHGALCNCLLSYLWDKPQVKEVPPAHWTMVTGPAPTHSNY